MQQEEFDRIRKMLVSIMKAEDNFVKVPISIQKIANFVA